MPSLRLETADTKPAQVRDGFGMCDYNGRRLALVKQITVPIHAKPEAVGVIIYFASDGRVDGYDWYTPGYRNFKPLAAGDSFTVAV
jgi:hypothetical protein